MLKILSLFALCTTVESFQFELKKPIISLHFPEKTGDFARECAIFARFLYGFSRILPLFSQKMPGFTTFYQRFRPFFTGIFTILPVRL